MVERFSGLARFSVFFAGYEALAEGGKDICANHLLSSIMYLCPSMLGRVVGAREDLRVLRQEVARASALAGAKEDDTREFGVAEESRSVLQRAGREARRIWRTSLSGKRPLPAPVRTGSWQVDPIHILLGVAYQGGVTAELLSKYGATAQTIRESLLTEVPRSAEMNAIDALVNRANSPLSIIHGCSVESDLDSIIGAGALEYTRSLYVAVLGAYYEATRVGATAVGASHLLAGLVAGSVVELRGARSIEAKLGPIRHFRA